jgi:hypothetical protein
VLNGYENNHQLLQRQDLARRSGSSASGEAGGRTAEFNGARTSFPVLPESDLSGNNVFDSGPGKREIGEITIGSPAV